MLESYCLRSLLHTEAVRVTVTAARTASGCTKKSDTAFEHCERVEKDHPFALTLLSYSSYFQRNMVSADFTSSFATLHQTGTESLVHVSSHCIAFLWLHTRAHTDIPDHRCCSACPQLADYLKSLDAPSSVQPLIERGAEAARDCSLFLQQQDPATTGLAVAGAAGEQLHQLPHGSSSRICT
jgi:hypothetical protein